MFKRKDVIRTLFLLVVILVIMVTLSQILVVHRRNHRSIKSRDSEKARGMLAMLLNIERSIEAMMKKEYLPWNKYLIQLTSEIYAERIKQQLLDLKDGDSRNGAKILKRAHKFGDGTYAAFRERKLRFLEMIDTDLLTKVYSNQAMSKMDKSNKIPAHIDSGSTISIGEANHNSPRRLHVSENDTERFTTTFGFVQQSNSSKTGHHENAKHTYTTLVRDDRNKKCPDVPSNLDGKTLITPRVPDPRLNEIQFPDIKPGGYWAPPKCIARQKTAIIIPYRNRETHLHTLLHYIIPVLKKQLIEFRIFVPEQDGEATFNKGRVMNAGFMEAWKLWSFDCAIFHDVDLLPENDRNMYTCGKFPRHMSISVDKFSYRLPYWTLVGGVFSIKREQFLQVNGYSNLYWGWGAEDDDMAYRLKSCNLKIERPPATIGRYKMIKHANRETSPVKMRAYLLKTVKKRYQRDGLNTLDYRVIFTNNTRLYTHILVDIGQPPDEAANITKLLN